MLVQATRIAKRSFDKSYSSGSDSSSSGKPFPPRLLMPNTLLNDALPLAKRKIVQVKEESESSEDEKPLSIRKDDLLANHVQKSQIMTNKPKTPSKPAKITRAPKSENLSAKDKKNKLSKSDSSSSKTDITENPDDGDISEDEYKWWMSHNQDDSIKWNTLEHQGVLFPPDYVPHGKPILYEGKPVYFEPEIEELVGFFAALLETDHAKNKVFQKNFFKDLLALMKKSKKILKDEKQKIDDFYGYCYLDGRKEKVGNFRIEPPGLFRGRGAHPKTGLFKKRVVPEQITLNIGKGAKIPEPPKGHKWGNIIHDQTVTWLATWKENVNDSTKYVFLAAGSSIKGQSDLKKFEKARTLKSFVSQIRKDYTVELGSKDVRKKQRATAMYLIDRLALRAGNEKGDDQADTVGCCSLRYEHISLAPDNTVIFDFLGKDSIRYYNEVQVTPRVYKNLHQFIKTARVPGKMIFDKINPNELNKHLSSLMPGLSAKVFRTYNASHTFQKELENTDNSLSIQEKLLAYNRANRQVAILCNHQRTVTKSHDSQMSKMNDKILALKYQRNLHLDQLASINKKAKKTYSNLYDLYVEGITDEWKKDYYLDLVAKDRERITKKKEKVLQQLEQDEETKKEDKKSKQEIKQARDDAKDAISAIDEELDMLSKKEESINKGKYVPGPILARNPTEEKLVAGIEKLSDRISVAETQKIDKDENKTTALSTSKINYIDPRISVAWCKKFDVPVDKIFNRALKEKFKWAMEVDANWTF
ncbi:DNA topoisomerase 1 [Smittium culicis]|uniref:DNA topoisomerase I n=1 Tax=Smittium culicis TaxID=133412 RepID=A0A1R1YBS7_9FUNG|nr:DNA topoisomerase 1 [Smittium culicis]